MQRRRRLTSAVVLAGLLVVIVGALRLVLPGQAGLVGPWRRADGQSLPDGLEPATDVLMIRTFRGAEHCDADSATFLQLAVPFGSPVDPDDPGELTTLRTFVRDPDHVFGAGPEVPFDVVRSAPPTAVDTGFQRRGNRLAVDPGGQAYLTRPSGVVERWSRFDDYPGCD